ncbi:MAG: single-stranded DNA-binding protein [Bifidobacterium mongoliense]|nr:single-stranded DNA-binding protein [Bifidobacterium mongoliense]
MINGIPSLIVGNLGRAPESQQVNGKTIARISVCVTPRVKKQGQWCDGAPVWYRVTVWDQYTAQHILNSLHKGDRVVCYGIVTSDEYQGKVNLGMSADVVGVDLNRSDVQVMPRQNNGGQPRQTPGYANRQATRQQAPASDPWGAGDGFTRGGADDFGGDGTDAF